MALAFTLIVNVIARIDYKGSFFLHTSPRFHTCTQMKRRVLLQVSLILHTFWLGHICIGDFIYGIEGKGRAPER